MKTCGKCKQSKPLEDFNKGSGSQGRHGYCRLCQKQHYKSNSKHHIANVAKNNERYRKAAREAIVPILRTGCVDCGNTDIRVLEFDHLDNKVAGVGSMILRGARLEAILEEVAKCEVRCKNCHTIKTYERLGGTWHDTFLCSTIGSASGR